MTGSHARARAAHKQFRVTRRRLIENAGLLSAGLMASVHGIPATRQPPQQQSLFERALIEMRDTRNFLADWFAGRAQRPERAEDFYLSGVLAANFTIVRPDGHRLSREQTLQIFFERLHGSDPAVLRHDNVNIQPILERADLVVVGYDEHHVYADHATVNALTAVLVEDQRAPNGVRWQLVHETPIRAGRE